MKFYKCMWNEKDVLRFEIFSVEVVGQKLSDFNNEMREN